MRSFPLLKKYLRTKKQRLNARIIVACIVILAVALIAIQSKNLNKFTFSNISQGNPESTYKPEWGVCIVDNPGPAFGNTFCLPPDGTSCAQVGGSVVDNLDCGNVEIHSR